MLLLVVLVLVLVLALVLVLVLVLVLLVLVLELLLLTLLLLLLLEQTLGLSGTVKLGPNALPDAEQRHGGCDLLDSKPCRRRSNLLGSFAGGLHNHLGAVR